ncbi:MAG: Ig-like domain-containing protein, partial [Pseudomonadota bacterium]
MLNENNTPKTSSNEELEVNKVSAGEIPVENAELMFKGEYSVSSSDLVIKGTTNSLNPEVLVIEGFFSGGKQGLIAPNGATLSFETVKALAGPENPAQFAATGDEGSGAEKIGEIVKLEGSAKSRKTDGIETELKIGDPVFQGDVVSTGDNTKLGITFIDETVFSMSANSTMVLDELVYKGPGDSDNSMVMNLVQGTFVFVTGEVAPSGSMQIETPVATMGIRGTTPKVTVDTNLGVGEFSILPDPDTGNVGSYVLINKSTGEIIGRVETVEKKWVLTSLTGDAVEIGKSGIDLLEDRIALDEIRDIFSRSFGDRAQLDGSNSFGRIGFGSLSAGDRNVDGLGAGDDDGLGDEIAGEDGEGEPGDPPIAEDDEFFSGEDPVLIGQDVVAGTGGGVDFDPDGFAVLVTQVNGEDLTFVGGIASVLLPSGGILVISENGGITYDPNDAYEFLGLGDEDVDTFEYTITDPEGFTDVATVTITLTGSNDQPQITNIATTVLSDAFTEAGDTGNSATTRTA